MMVAQTSVAAMEAVKSKQIYYILERKMSRLVDQQAARRDA